MTVDPALEAPQPSTGPGFSDAVTFAFGDPATDLYGVARLGLSTGADGETQASGLAVLFAGSDPIAVRAAGGLALTGPGWDAIDAAGVTTAVDEPLRGWRVTFRSEDETAGFDLAFAAASEPAALDAETPAGEAGGMVGYEQLCRVTGTVRARGGDRQVECLGQRGHSWGSPDWDSMQLVRTVSAWVGDDLAASLTAVRGAKAKEHADEALGAAVFSRDDEAPEGALATAVAIAEPRLSTTYDGEHRQRRASLELYPDEEGYAIRAAGDVRCGTTLDLGRLRLDCSFFTWQMEGRTGVGRYDVLRRVEA